MRYYPPAKKCKLDSVWVGPYLVMSLVGWALGIQKHPDQFYWFIALVFYSAYSVGYVPDPYRDLGGLSEYDGCGWFANGCFIEFLDLGGGTFFVHCDSDVSCVLHAFS